MGIIQQSGGIGDRRVSTATEKCHGPTSRSVAHGTVDRIDPMSDGTERVRLLVKYEPRNHRSDRPQALLRSTVYNSHKEDRRGSGLAPAASVGGRPVMLCSPLDS